MDILNVSVHPLDRNPNTRSLTLSRQTYLLPLKQSQDPSKTFITRPFFSFESSPKPKPYHPKTLLCCVVRVEHNFTELY